MLEELQHTYNRHCNQPLSSPLTPPFREATVADTGKYVVGKDNREQWVFFTEVNEGVIYIYIYISVEQFVRLGLL